MQQREAHHGGRPVRLQTSGRQLGPTSDAAATFTSVSSLITTSSTMPIDFSTYLIHISEAINTENGPNLAYLLRPTSPHGKDLVKEFRNPTVRRV